jgi:hypothetical protein
MNKFMSIFYISIVLVICPRLISAETFDQNSATLTNAYLPIKVGDKLTYKTYGYPFVLYAYIEAIDQEIVDQVNCLKIRQSDSFSSTAIVYYWFAEDTSGNIRVLKYHDQELNDLRYYGRDGAKLVMPSKVNIGTILWNPDGTETIVATGIAVPELSTGLGPFYNCIKTKISYADKDIDYNYYAPQIGQIKFEFNDDGGINGLEISKIFRRSTSMPWLQLLLE